ncbi:hypothetical protein OV203_21095 [Nannocystis sp. ILAH1]|uniref:hypothetical protein n=1 Tax=unclassified Nannocystis TaxID=2627009 RepID=UPI00226F6FFD|nr:MULTISPECIES: hypothetical protein [unclassified Nannocystis]MCY0989648.1 hypothetical protein [Nannocystis sp. ILAH1]MCY1071252.1 hypothetical protein [Nannocystis sp. RBIL2]
MNPNKNFKPSHDDTDRDRGGPNTGLNQVNPSDTPRNREDGEKGHQGGDPGEVRPSHLQHNRDSQPDGHRDLGYDPSDPREIRRRGKNPQTEGKP